MPEATSARKRAVATDVFPTPVSVPVTKMPRATPIDPGAESFTIGCPSTERLGSPFHAWPYTTSNVAGMRPSRRIASNAGKHALPAPAPHQPMRPAPRGVGGANLFQLAHQGSRVGVGQSQLLHVHHRIGEARRNQHVADVVHVGEAVRMRVTVGARERGTDFLQCVRTECREREKAADLQYAPDFGERARQVVRPLQRKVAP